MLRPLIAAFALAVAPAALAQAPVFPTPQPMAIQPEPDAIPLYPGVAPGYEKAQQKETWSRMGGEGGEIWIRNVVRPTLTPFLPAAGKATGAAVLVVPGGGFSFVSASNEGWPIARWLADRGVAAFVLKYRVMETPASEADFGAQMAALFRGPRPPTGETPPAMAAQVPFARADAQAGLKMIRGNAAKWGIDPARVGMLGFSAGAMTTLATALANAPDARPDFIAPIYGQMAAVTPPPSPQPLFAAIASDDVLLGGQGLGLVESWEKAGGSVELHYYSGGNHGFGSHKRGTTSDLWFEQFMAWLQAGGWLKPRG